MLKNNVERWLIHENYRFHQDKRTENNFTFVINHVGAFGNPIEVFEPRNQPNVLVIGTKISLKNYQMMRFQKLTEKEKTKIEQKIAEFCYSIKAVHRILNEDGKIKVGVYIVLERFDEINHHSFIETLAKVTEMGDKTNQFLLKTF